ncbi:MAG: GIY-YIG nuclease family protein, partial [Cyclobacteriaceae bacterium]
MDIPRIPKYDLNAHNKGLNKSTAGRGPWKFIFLREFNNKKETLEFESHLKKLKNKKYIKINTH